MLYKFCKINNGLEYVLLMKSGILRFDIPDSVHAAANRRRCSRNVLIHDPDRLSVLLEATNSNTAEIANHRSHLAYSINSPSSRRIFWTSHDSDSVVGKCICYYLPSQEGDGDLFTFPRVICFQLFIYNRFSIVVVENVQTKYIRFARKFWLKILSIYKRISNKKIISLKYLILGRFNVSCLRNKFQNINGCKYYSSLACWSGPVGYRCKC